MVLYSIICVESELSTLLSNLLNNNYIINSNTPNNKNPYLHKYTNTHTV